MTGKAVTLVLVFAALAALHLAVFGQSRQVMFGDDHPVKVKGNAVEMRFKGRLDGMRKVLVQLPDPIKRRPMEPVLVEGDGAEHALTDTGEFSRTRSRRTYWIDPPIDAARGRDFTLVLAFTDGDVLAPGQALETLAVTVYHDLDWANTFENFKAFKPFPFLAVLLSIAVAAGAAVLLGSLGPSRR